MGRIVLGGVGDGIGLQLAEKGFKQEGKECSWWMAELEVGLHCCWFGDLLSCGMSGQGMSLPGQESALFLRVVLVLQDEANRNAKAWEGKAEIQLC